MSLRIYGNRQLKTLPGQATRPTLARVREALFNIWQGEVDGCRWLDLCTGTGSMGAEALCRGAALVIGIEQSARACAVIQENWQQVANADQTFQVIRGDVRQRLPNLTQPPFDRIYFDPPYASELYQPVLEAIAHHHLLTATGELAVEHDPNQEAIVAPSSLEICRQKRYGNTALTFYRPVA
ncbi:16S rRNA (guanine(966)-N(2))-methyltransferase RsmD [Oculatella sp. LEGE 06141]|uniref:16S rRNA (guanine(966)-N(2))-methyltransferase RsmD n=1 Tax=Oculatella sp. LEGE 06141 TaxID=1828648 RepID=UPI001882ACE8|nr:16S rRNA (guanine(966)-N(2))-methyltransferase RsmD [Oculatella sp. LEGE 06141]MBE9182301.1 16S rRNA (guanine(966)-N(2))-methyltransferase RsmD [Oculatella sp. LEGE 06141]